MTELEKILRKELYRRSFYEFVKAFWHTMDPSKFVDGKLIQIYCEFFQYMCRRWTGYDEVEVKLPKLSDDINIIDIREDKNNININVPPRHTKSLIFNVLGPVWLWTYYPIKAVSISHTGALATEMNGKRYAIINSEDYKELYSDIELVVNSTSFLKDKRGAELRSLNRNAFTGYGGDVIVNDDLTNAQTASKDQMEMANAWSYYQNTMPSRINDPTKCIIMNIQQRLAPNDITGHIMNDKELSESYVFVVFPAIFDKETYIVCPISGEIVHFNKGDYLWPERFGDYSQLKVQVGISIFETQYLQHPVASDKAVIKETDIQEKSIIETPGITNADIIYASHDFPVKDKDTSDFLGSVLAYRSGANLYIVDCLEKRLAFVKSVQYVKNLDIKYPGIIQIIEDKANGAPILQQLQDEVAGMQAFQPGTASKTQRLESASLYINNVYFVKTKYNKLLSKYEFTDTMENLIKRLLQFPYVEHDDICDAFSQLVLFTYMDKRFQVYGRAFNDDNIVETTKQLYDYDTIFFNKEGDIWKALRIAVQYGIVTKIIVLDEIRFKASSADGLEKLKEFANDKNVFIDCSATDALRGYSTNSVTIEKYDVNDFDMSVTKLNLAFSNNLVLINKSCVLTKADIENFKFSKSKDESVKYLTEKDGFVSCLRLAIQYYGGIV